MMDSLIFLIFHIIIYGLIPLLIVTIFCVFKSTFFFYSYYGFLFVFTQLFATMYSLEISENLIITGGNIAYSSIILITIFIYIVSQDPNVVRNLISIQIILNLIIFFLYQLLIIVFQNPTTINLFGVSYEIFYTTIYINIISSLCYIIEVLLMFYLFEKIKKRIKQQFLFISLCIIVYIGILCLDGFIFPFFIAFFNPEFVQFIAGNILGKLILGILFSPFLLIFKILHKKSIFLFSEKLFSIRDLILPKRKDIIKKLQRVEENLKKTEKKFEEAYKRATFYKDLFTHDMSNIIQSISMSFWLLKVRNKDKDKINTENSEGFFNLLDNQLSRARNLIFNIRKLTKLNEYKEKLENTTLLEPLSNTINMVKESIPGKKIDIKLDSGYKEIIIKANELLADVFENILFNAIKYNNSLTPEIIIKISIIELNKVNYVKLEFKDNGIGIPDFKKEKIFLDKYKDLKGEKGMGIGLSLSTEIIKSYKGKIWMEDRIKGDYSKGSNFIILIPEIKVKN